MGRVVARFWQGYICDAAERPTWLIRWHYACGCIQGAVRLLVLGRPE
jgi:hypothetical protein